MAEQRNLTKAAELGGTCCCGPLRPAPMTPSGEALNRVYEALFLLPSSLLVRMARESESDWLIDPGAALVFRRQVAFVLWRRLSIGNGQRNYDLL